MIQSFFIYKFLTTALSNKKLWHKIWEIILMHGSKIYYLAAAHHFWETNLTNWPISTLNFNKFLQAVCVI